MIADIPRLEQLLLRLEDHWRRVDAPVLQRARPGLSADQIDAKTGAVGLRLPAEARIWFQWHDGVEPALAHEARMGPSFYLPALDHRVRTYIDEREFAAEAFREGWAETADELWPRSWFPIIDSAVGRSPVVIDTAVPDGHTTPVGLMQKETTDRPREERSLTHLVQFWVECHDHGFYQWRADERTWRADPDAGGATRGIYANFYM